MVFHEENQTNNASPNPDDFFNKRKTYLLEFDKAKIFWVFVLSLLVLTFVFVFGYWIGQYNMKDYTKIAKNISRPEELKIENSSHELKEILALEKEEKEEFETKKLEEKNEKIDEKIDEKNYSINKENNENKLLRKKIVKDIKVNRKERSITKKKVSNNRVNKISSSRSKKYAIQLASFKKRNKAMKFRRILLGKGYGGYIVKVGRMYKVRVGNFSNYNKAANILAVVMRKFRIRDAYIFKVNRT